MNKDVEALIIRFIDTFSDEAVFIIDSDYKIVYANLYALANASLKNGHILGKSLLYDFYEGRKFDQNGNYISPLIKAVDTGVDIPNVVISTDSLQLLPCRYYHSRTMVAKDSLGRIKYAIGCYKILDKEIALETKLSSINHQIIESMATTIDARDTPTSRHSFNVADMALAFAEHLGLDKDEVHQLYLAGLIHDIGKIGIPEAVLHKPGKLTIPEYEIVKQHPIIGANILLKIDALVLLSKSVRHHHERYDGTGYPDRLSGQSIPLHSRIISLCDAFDAMTAQRIYKPPLLHTSAYEEIRHCRGKQFDPKLADEFVSFLILRDSQKKHLLQKTGGLLYRRCRRSTQTN